MLIVPKAKMFGMKIKFIIFLNSAVCLLSADCLLSHLETSNADSAQSKDVRNENLEFL